MGQQRESVVSRVEELIGQLKETERAFHEIAVETRITSVSSVANCISGISRKAADALRRNIQQEMELEGGGTTGWYVCPECHGEIDSSDHYCRHCGQAVKWE